MKSEDIYTVGDLISFLQQLDSNLLVRVWDPKGGQDNPLQHIDIESDRVIIYD